jgi:hypothetical protein
MLGVVGFGLGLDALQQGISIFSTCLRLLPRSHVRQVDTPWLDDNKSRGVSFIKTVADIFYFAMNPSCASNVVSLLCHASFRECVPVKDELNGGTRFLPSLLCRSECEKHWETWNTCVADLNADSEKQEIFNTKMQSLVRHKMVFVCCFRMLWSLTWCIHVAIRSIAGGIRVYRI